MSSYHLIDPELRAFLPLLPDLDLPGKGIKGVRETLEAWRRLLPEPDGLTAGVKICSAKAKDGHAIGLQVITPPRSTGPLPLLLQLHGGGYVLGSAELSRVANMMLAAEVGCVVVSVDYRLAPEVRHPIPLEDCYSALIWVLDHAAELGGDQRRIAVMGESAGGGLAAALTQLARDRGEVSIVHQHLIYPMLDDRTCNDENALAGEFVWTAQCNRIGWSALLGHRPGDAEVEPYAAAARAMDLAGLPPAFISVGALDLFAGEDLAYADRLMRAGVSVELHLYPGAYHVFDACPDAVVAQAARRASVEALMNAFSRVTA